MLGTHVRLWNTSQPDQWYERIPVALLSAFLFRNEGVLDAAFLNLQTDKHEIYPSAQGTHDPDLR